MDSLITVNPFTFELEGSDYKAAARCGCARCGAVISDRTPRREASFSDGEVFNEAFDGEFEYENARGKTQRAVRTYFRDFSGDPKECTSALLGGKTRAEAVSTINTLIGESIRMLRRAAKDLKRENRTATTRKLFLQIFRVRPEFVPECLKQTDQIKDRGDVVAVRCARVADLLESRTLKYFCKISAKDCPDCGDDNTGHACSSWGKHKVVCIGPDFWGDFKSNNKLSMLSVIMHEPFHVYFGKYATDHNDKTGKFGGIYCIVHFVFRLHGRNIPQWMRDVCEKDMKARK